MASPSFHSSSIVFPSQPTPNGKLSLSEIDQMVDWIHFSTIYVYKPSPKTSFSFNSFKNALSQVLVPYYPMAGRLRWIGGGRLELDCCAAGARLIDASIDAKLDDYGDFAPSDRLRQQLVPTFDENDPIEKIPVFMAQVTRFSCGGIVIGTAIPHTLADGASAKMFLNAWASIARGEKTKESVLQPFHNRTKALQPQKPLLPPRFHHREFDESPTLLNRSDTVDEERKEYKVASLKVTKDQVEKLKKIANDKLIVSSEDGVEPRKRPYSRYECITAHIWVCICKARSSGETNVQRQQTAAYIPISIKSRLATPLPEGFFGNTSMIAVTPTCEYGELMAKPLSYVAGKIREGIVRFTDEYVKSAMNFLASQEEMWLVRKRWLSIGSSHEAALWENPNLYVDSWLSLSFYDLDFGWGTPCYVGPAKSEVDGESFLVPGPPDEGSLILILRLQAKFMDEFKKLFYESL